MTNRKSCTFAAAIVLSLSLNACGDLPNNRSVNSVNQPVVEQHNFTIDLTATPNGLSVPERRRLADWFESMDVRYGDRIGLDGPQAAGRTRDDVAAIAGRYRLLLSDGAPVTEGFIQPGTVRVVVTRSRAYVPHCPDWSDRQATNFDNSTSDGYGCAINGNIAAMVADPQHLLHGAQSTSETVVMSSTKAIQSYRSQAPTGTGGLKATSSQSGGGS